MDIPSIIIGNPENRRVTLFQEELKKKGLPQAEVIPYLSLLKKEISLSDYLQPKSLVRIDSPGENFQVEREIIALGEICEGRDIGASALEESLGEIRYPSLWFSGFKTLMNSILREVENCSPEHRWYNHPDEIVTMFDKSGTKELLSRNGIRTTSIHPQITSCEEFREYVREERLSRLFIKLNSSSSASGVAAYEYSRKRGAEQIYTTIEIDLTAGRPRFFNSLKVKKYSDRESIERVLDFLFAQGALIEKWIPKSLYEKSAYDLRVLAVDSRMCQKIGRLSSSPMTNLHLGNRRVDPEALHISEELWEDISDSVKRTMVLFPKSLYAGLDVIVPRGGGNPVILEVNAFGDLLPNIYFQGNESYGTEIEAQMRRLSA